MMMKWIAALTLVLLSGCAGVEKTNISTDSSSSDILARRQKRLETYAARQQSNPPRITPPGAVPPVVAAPVEAKVTPPVAALAVGVPKGDAPLLRRQLVKQHRILLRHYPIRVYEVGIQFSPPAAQKGWMLYSIGVLPETTQMIAQAEQELCLAAQSVEVPHDVITFPLRAQVYQLEDTGPMRFRSKLVSEWLLPSCLTVVLPVAPNVSLK
jgi:hypothetical protein